MTYIIEVENQGNRWFWRIYLGQQMITCQPYHGTKPYAIRRAIHELPAGVEYKVVQNDKVLQTGLNYSDPEGSIQ